MATSRLLFSIAECRPASLTRQNSLTSLPGLDERIGRSDADLLKDVSEIQSVMSNLGFHADTDELKTAVYERRARYVDGE
ncbi:hypothetical protein [Glycomyces sp. MUSA5-2]|uniref:hypothetical protein n=1 Tax=Glycomyces sp. MUSA5-2 TaxID=2053002 RepID=UPI00300A676C